MNLLPQYCSSRLSLLQCGSCHHSGHLPSRLSRQLETQNPVCLSGVGSPETLRVSVAPQEIFQVTVENYFLSQGSRSVQGDCGASSFTNHWALLKSSAMGETWRQWGGIPGVQRQCTGQTVWHAFLVYFLAFFISGPQYHSHLWNALTRSIFPMERSGGLAASPEVITVSSSMPEPVHPEQKSGPLETQERQPTRILAIADPLSRVLLFFIVSVHFFF